VSNPVPERENGPLRIEPRWTDLDPIGHVNNSVYLVYAEEARARFLGRAIPDAWRLVVVVHNSIDYHSPVETGEVVDVTSAVEKIGTSSFVSRSVISTDNGRKCATVRTVQVVLRADRTGARPWTDEERAALTGLIGPSSEVN
jgi:acyl-CoA thioester hydrolase